jgi:hypothetical protein
MILVQIFTATIRIILTLLTLFSIILFLYGVWGYGVSRNPHILWRSVLGAIGIVIAVIIYYLLQRFKKTNEYE